MHRGCLNQWRATREDRAFAQCTECSFRYVYAVVTDADEQGVLFADGPLTPKRLREAKFKLLIARDFLAVFSVVQVREMFLRCRCRCRGSRWCCWCWRCCCC